MAKTYNFKQAWVEAEEVFVNWRFRDIVKVPLVPGKTVESKQFSGSGDAFGESFKLELHLAGFSGSTVNSTAGYVAMFLAKTNCWAHTATTTILNFSVSLCNQLKAENTVRMTLAANSTVPGPLGVQERTARVGWVDFVKYADMVDPNKGFLVSGEIFVKAELKISVSHVQDVVDPPLAGDAVATCVRNLFKSKALSDVKLIADGREFESHRAILACRSKVFEAMFSSPMAESNGDAVTIEDISADTLQLMLHFIYTDTIDEADPEPAIIGDLLKAAKKYDIARLSSLCEKKALAAISLDSVADWIMLATMLEAHDIKRACMQLIAENFREVQVTEGWNRLLANRELLSDILPSIMECMSPPAKQPGNNR